VILLIVVKKTLKDANACKNKHLHISNSIRQSLARKLYYIFSVEVILSE
jgi:hypothetical protein